MEEGEAGYQQRWCVDCKEVMSTRHYHCNDGGLRRGINRCLPWYHHTCKWFGGPIFLPNLKTYLVSVIQLPFFQLYLTIVTIWSLAVRQQAYWSNTTLVVAALASTIFTVAFVIHVTQWAWTIAVKDNRLPAESGKNISINVKNHETQRSEIERFPSRDHSQHAFDCGRQTNFHLYLGPTVFWVLAPIPLFNLIPVFVPPPILKFKDNKSWDKYPWPQDSRVARTHRRVFAKPEPEQGSSTSVEPYTAFIPLRRRLNNSEVVEEEDEDEISQGDEEMGAPAPILWYNLDQVPGPAGPPVRASSDRPEPVLGRVHEEDEEEEE